MTEFKLESTDESDYSDEELQEALASGKLKPGLNQVIEQKGKAFTNRVSDMKVKISEMKLNLPWIETLDLINKEAPLAPELAAQMHEKELRRANELKNNLKLPQYAPSEDPVLNDFKREMMFHRQAQAAVLEGISRLKAMGIATKRPDDYFAEMAKSDKHMQKVRQALMQKQSETQQRERVRQLRIQRKEGKAVQIQAKLHKQQQKKEMLDQVKKVRKGFTKNLDFLDGNKPSKKAVAKQKFKNKKYGFGGKKRDSKRNTKNSSAEFSEHSGPKKGNFKNKGKQGKQRPGKNRRQKMKAKGNK